MPAALDHEMVDRLIRGGAVMEEDVEERGVVGKLISKALSVSEAVRCMQPAVTSRPLSQVEFENLNHTPYSFMAAWIRSVARH